MDNVHMYKKWILALFISILFHSSVSLAWQEQTTPDNNVVKVWTKTVGDSRFKAFRGEVMIAAPMQQVFDFIADTPKAAEWYYNTVEAKQLERLGNKQFLVYSVTRAPWPVHDRDSVTLITVDDKKAGEITIKLQAKPDAIPYKENLVRIPKLDGYWKLEQIKPNLTKVIFEVDALPGGKLPSCLANSMAVDMPYRSLSQLKTQIETNQNFAQNQHSEKKKLQLGYQTN